jgi:hypothetical protein
MRRRCAATHRPDLCGGTGTGDVVGKVGVCGRRHLSERDNDACCRWTQVWMAWAEAGWRPQGPGLLLERPQQKLTLAGLR